jgi:hypothetical protein
MQVVCIRVLSFPLSLPLPEIYRQDFSGSDTTLTQPIPQRTVAPPGPSPSLWPKESIALPTPSGVLYPQSSRRSSLRALEDRVSRTREPCAHLACCETPIPDPRVHGQ